MAGRPHRSSFSAATGNGTNCQTSGPAKIAKAFSSHPPNYEVVTSITISLVCYIRAGTAQIWLPS